MSEGAVFVATNHHRGNEILVYKRRENGSLELLDSITTNRNGCGANRHNADSLGSQNSLILNKDKTLLFVVNASNDSFSIFRIIHNPLSLKLERTTSIPNGKFPVSLAIYENTLYVLTTGLYDDFLQVRYDGLITGFQIRDKGQGQVRVNLVDASVRNLNFFANNENTFPRDVNILETPSQIEFSPDGKFLVVAIKGAQTSITPSRILVFPVERMEQDNEPVHVPAITPATITIKRRPFGFTFYDNDKLFVCEIKPTTDARIFSIADAEVKTTVATYKIEAQQPTPTISRIDEKISQNKVFCWTGGPKPNPHTWPRGTLTADFGSDSVSPYSVNESSKITVGDSVSTGGNSSYPLEMSFDQDNRFLYVTQPGDGKISIWQVQSDGSGLAKIGEINEGILPYNQKRPMDGGAIAGIAAY